MAIGLKYRFGYDDSLDVVGVHLAAGLWGTVGLALLSKDNGVFTGGGVDGLKLLLVQIVIAVVAMILSGVVTYLIALVIKVTIGWRVDDEGEDTGIDLVEHRESAYDLKVTSSSHIRSMYGVENPHNSAHSKPENSAQNKGEES